MCVQHVSTSDQSLVRQMKCVPFFHNPVRLVLRLSNRACLLSLPLGPLVVAAITNTSTLQAFTSQDEMNQKKGLLGGTSVTDKKHVSPEEQRRAPR